MGRMIVVLSQLSMSFPHSPSPPWSRITKVSTIIIGCLILWYCFIVYSLPALQPHDAMRGLFERRVASVVTHNATIVYDTGYARISLLRGNYDGSLVGRIDNIAKRKEIVSQTVDTIFLDCARKNNPQRCMPWNKFSALGAEAPGGTESFLREIKSTASLYGPNWPIHLPTPARSVASSLVDHAVSAPHAACTFNIRRDFLCLDPDSGAFVYRYWRGHGYPERDG